MADMNETKAKELCRRVKQYNLDTFQDSENRFNKMHKTRNDYVFRDAPFSIDCNVQYTLNPILGRKRDPNFKEPGLWINLIFGGTCESDFATGRSSRL